MKPLSPLHDFADLRGKPFVRGGRTPDGFDCRGLTYIVRERMGAPLPEDALPSHDTVTIDLDPAGLPDQPWSRYWKAVPPGHERVGDVAFYSDGKEQHVAPIVSATRNQPIQILSSNVRHNARLVEMVRKPGLVGVYRLKDSP